jgi:sodium-dependent dicarboxylate transporter 2/3/5
MKYNYKNSKFISFILAVFLLMLSIPLSNIMGFEPLQVKGVCFLFAALILWISDAIPMALATLLLIFLLPLFGLMEYNDVVGSFGVGTSLFIMASSGITVAIAKSNIPHKIAELVFVKMCKHPIGLIYCFGLSVTIFSGFVSSLATCTLFTALAATALNNLKLDKKTSGFAKSLMLTIPACAGIGGFISPAGTPANILVLDILKEKGVEITFGKWCSIGLPISLLASFIFLSLLVIILKPEKINVSGALVTKSFNKNDYIVLSIVLLVILGWFLSGFVPELNITLIAIIGLIIFFIPSIEILSFGEFSSGVNWNLVFTMGSVSVLMIAIANTGLITNVTTFFTPFLTSTTIYWLLFGISVLICFIRAFVPTTTAVIALLVPMLVAISAITSVNYATLLLIASFWAATALLLIYTEPIYLISYKEGYFKQGDLIKVGLPASIIIAAICPYLIYIFMR